jgi:hypothetical protein
MLEDAARERVRTAEDRVLDLAKGLQAHFDVRFHQEVSHFFHGHRPLIRLWTATAVTTNGVV